MGPGETHPVPSAGVAAEAVPVGSCCVGDFAVFPGTVKNSDSPRDQVGYFFFPLRKMIRRDLSFLDAVI